MNEQQMRQVLFQAVEAEPQIMKSFIQGSDETLIPDQIFLGVHVENVRDLMILAQTFAVLSHHV